VGEIHPFPDRDHDIGVGQPLDKLIEVPRRRAIAHHVVVAD
jgi:hypothetical protein